MNGMKVYEPGYYGMLLLLSTLLVITSGGLTYLMFTMSGFDAVLRGLSLLIMVAGGVMTGMAAIGLYRSLRARR